MQVERSWTKTPPEKENNENHVDDVATCKPRPDGEGEPPQGNNSGNQSEANYYDPVAVWLNREQRDGPWDGIGSVNLGGTGIDAEGEGGGQNEGEGRGA